MENQLTFEIHADLDLISKEVPCQRVVELVVQAPQAMVQNKRPSLNLALVIDRSGSMSGDKLMFAKQAALHVLDLLQDQDQVSIVAYDDNIVTLAPATPVTQAARSEIAARIGSLETGGCTNLGDGWLKGCECLGNALIEKGINRVLLLSDGLANRGITDLEELGQHARGLRDRGISTSTFGIGLDFNEHLLEHMSNQGGGNFYYIQSPYMIPEIFMQEFNELAAVTARDVEINLKIPAHVASQVLGSWKHELVQDELTILVGDMASNQKRELYVRLLCPQYENLAQLTLVGTAKCKGENSQVYEISAELVFRYVDNEAQRNAPLNQGVMERYSLVEVADVATQALKLERQGEYGKANQLLQQSIGEHEAYLPAGKVEYYQELASRAKTGLSEPDRKSSHYVAYSEKKTR